MLRSFRRRSTCCDVFDRDVQRFVRVAGVSSPDDDGRHRDADLDLHLGIAARHEHDCESQGGAEAARGESRLCMVPHSPDMSEVSSRKKATIFHCYYFAKLKENVSRETKVISNVFQHIMFFFK